MVIIMNVKGILSGIIWIGFVSFIVMGIFAYSDSVLTDDEITTPLVTTDTLNTDTIGSKSGSGISWTDSQNASGNDLTNGGTYEADNISDGIAYMKKGVLHSANLNGSISFNNENRVVSLGYEESGIRFYDSSGHDNDAICVGSTCPSIADGRFGKTRSYDGVNDYTTIIYDSDLDFAENTTSQNYFTKGGIGNPFYTTIHPRGRYYNNKTYITYTADHFDPYIRSYNHISSTWSKAERVGTTSLSQDSHGNPAMIIDNDGYIHVFYGAHNGPLKYAKSKYSDNITYWNDMTDITNMATYPQAILMSNGDIYLFYRAGNGHYTDWSYRVSTDNGDSWSGETVVLEATAASIGYYPYIYEGTNDSIHITTCYKGTGSAWNRYNTYYVMLNSSGNLLNISGDDVGLPINKINLDALALIYDSGANHSAVHAMDVDDDNNPYQVFTTGTGTTYIYKFANWSAGALTLYDITTTDHLFDQANIITTNSSHHTVFLTSGGTTASGSGDDDNTDRGGNIEEWETIDGGATWAKVQDIITKAETNDVFSAPSIIEDYNSNAKLAFYEYVDDNEKQDTEIYMWGDSGFLNNSISDSESVLFSFSLRMKQFSIGSHQMITSRWGSEDEGRVWRVLSYTSGGENYIRFEIIDTSYNSYYSQNPNPIIANEEYNVIGVYDGTMIYLYVDGVLVDSDSAGSNVNLVEKPIIIGATGNSPAATDYTFFFNGTIDDVEFFSRVLTTQEIQLKSLGHSTTPTGHFLPKTGGIVTDVTAFEKGIIIGDGTSQQGTIIYREDKTVGCMKCYSDGVCNNTAGVC